MALNIKNQNVERLASEIAKMTGESKTEAIRRALEERRERLSYRIQVRDRRVDLLEFLEQEIWSGIPRDQIHRTLTKDEEESILGYGQRGV